MYVCTRARTHIHTYTHEDMYVCMLYTHTTVYKRIRRRGVAGWVVKGWIGGGAEMVHRAWPITMHKWPQYLLVKEKGLWGARWWWWWRSTGGEGN